MLARIQLIAEKRFIGKSIRMSFTNNKTAGLWHSFMSARKEINNTIGLELYSAEVYPPLYFSNFNPSGEFDKWAAVEVNNSNEVPEGMETLFSPEGLYAVFIHKGPASEGMQTYNFIFTQWLPLSGYTLDNRPHFAVMGTKYKQDFPDSEEEIWIPVKESTK